MSKKTAQQVVEETLVDMVRVQHQLVNALRRAGGLAGIDCRLMTDARARSAQLISDLRLGEIKVERWKPPTDDDLSDLVE